MSPQMLLKRHIPGNIIKGSSGRASDLQKIGRSVGGLQAIHVVHVRSVKLERGNRSDAVPVLDDLGQCRSLEQGVDDGK